MLVLTPRASKTTLPYVCLVVDDVIASQADITAFFEGAVRGAAGTRGYDPDAASTQYLVGLLAHYAKPEGLRRDALLRPLTLLYREALEAPQPERFEKLRALGDDALYICGFFPDHFEHRGVAPKFVQSVGAGAYDAASAMLRRAGPMSQGPDVFDELASNFGSLVALLGDVADALYAVSARDPRGVLDLYERWIRRKSQPLAEALVRAGVTPTRGSGALH